jgi:hypothetical protein
MADTSTQEDIWRQQNDAQVYRKQLEYNERQRASIGGGGSRLSMLGGIDSARIGALGGGAVKALETVAPPQVKGVMAALQAAQTARKTLAAGAGGLTEAKALINQQYEMWLSTLMSGLIGPIFGLDLFISAPTFLFLFFARIIGGLTHWQVQGVYFFPPYNLKNPGGIAQFTTHLGAALFVIILYALIIFLIAAIAWFLTLSTWDQVKVTFGVGIEGLKSLFDAVTVGVSAGAGAASGL